MLRTVPAIVCTGEVFSAAVIVKCLDVTFYESDIQCNRVSHSILGRWCQGRFYRGGGTYQNPQVDGQTEMEMKMKGTIINKSLNMGANLSSLSRAETKLTEGSGG